MYRTLLPYFGVALIFSGCGKGTPSLESLDQRLSDCLIGSWNQDVSNTSGSASRIRSFEKDGSFSASLTLNLVNEEPEFQYTIGKWLVRDGTLVVTTEQLGSSVISSDDAKGHVYPLHSDYQFQEIREIACTESVYSESIYRGGNTADLTGKWVSAYEELRRKNGQFAVASRSEQTMLLNAEKNGSTEIKTTKWHIINWLAEPSISVSTNQVCSWHLQHGPVDTLSITSAESCVGGDPSVDFQYYIYNDALAIVTAKRATSFGRL